MNVSGREKQVVPDVERQFKLGPEMAAETADLAERDVPELRRRDPAARPKHIQLDALRVDLASFKEFVPCLEKPRAR